MLATGDVVERAVEFDALTRGGAVRKHLSLAVALPVPNPHENKPNPLLKLRPTARPALWQIIDSP